MLIDVQELEQFSATILNHAGLSETESQASAKCLVHADRRGVHSHGVTRLGAYAKRVSRGVVASHVKPEILQDAPTALLVDGCNGMGAPVGAQVMAMCIDRAREFGSGFAAVRHANHFGIAAHYTMTAAQQGMIGIAMSNAPASMAPLGGRQRMLGTNPLSIAIPAGDRPPLVLDMASSVVAQGKIILALKQGKSEIPAGWAVDVDGNATTDAKAALGGAMLPFGGPKGYAIAMIIEIFSSVLSGALASTQAYSFWDDFENPQGLGLFMGAWDVQKFMPGEAFYHRVDEIMLAFKASLPSAGCDEVLIPGELEHRQSQRADEIGIELDSAIVEHLQDTAKLYNVPWPTSWTDVVVGDELSGIK